MSDVIKIAQGTMGMLFILLVGSIILSLLLPVPLNLIAGGLMLCLLLFLIWFFRDPERNIPQVQDMILSPADGTVREVEKKGNLWYVSITMHIWSVHVNRAPCSGIVSAINHIPGEYHSVYSMKATEKNARQNMVIQTPDGTVLISRMVGRLARRITSWVTVGQEVGAGDRIGIIKFGSRTDIYFPSSWSLNPKTKVGVSIKAGETIIGYQRDHES